MSGLRIFLWKLSLFLDWGSRGWHFAEWLERTPPYTEWVKRQGEGR